jgi:PadR family transcriptional regulator AphA
MSNGKLTPTSYMILGSVALLSRATPYDLKGLVGFSIAHFWTFPHSQLYSEPERLAKMGLLTETRERGGRRRRVYSITDAGRQTLDEWLSDTSGDPPELRDPGILKLFFGNFGSKEAIRRLAESQVRMYEEQAEEHRVLAERFEGVTGIEFQLATLRCGMAVNEACLDFWKQVAAQPPGS